MSTDSESRNPLEYAKQAFGPRSVFRDGSFPEKGYRPDRPDSITKVIKVGEFYPSSKNETIDSLRDRVAEFCDALVDELSTRGGTGIGGRFDLNYPPIINIGQSKVAGELTASKTVYPVYVEIDYARDRGSWLNQISTRKAFNEALEAATLKIKEQDQYFAAKIVHTGMTRSHE